MSHSGELNIQGECSANLQTADTGEVALSGVWNLLLLRDDFGWRSGVVLDYSNSERAQQNRADERKYGTHRQHIEPQGKVHVHAPSLLK